jgi:hypothetical protein
MPFWELDHVGLFFGRGKYNMKKIPAIFAYLMLLIAPLFLLLPSGCYVGGGGGDYDHHGDDHGHMDDGHGGGPPPADHDQDHR